MAWQTPKLNWTEDDFYNPEDLNRVENNTLEVADLIKQILDNDVGLESIVTNRDYSAIEFADSLNRIERNIQKVSVLNLNGLVASKTTWNVGDAFSFKDAIRLETNTSIIYALLIKNVDNVPYCGNLNCGEDVI
ncbi:hypothetical protein AB8U03_13610 [Clostridium sp. Mt-5]|uniref:Uncharacterized protein n=1 Tax=Clostridium moutaii TaxID=3240932 RepID=A0ABV4BWJ3_9CLOT